MTPVATAEPLVRSLFDVAGGEPTLDKLLAGVWEGLAAHERVSCPVCGGDFEPEDGGGRCTSCGSMLR